MWFEYFDRTLCIRVFSLEANKGQGSREGMVQIKSIGGAKGPLVLSQILSIVNVLFVITF